MSEREVALAPAGIAACPPEPERPADGAAGAHAWVVMGHWWDFVFVISMAGTAALTGYEVSDRLRLAVLATLYSGIIAVYVTTRTRAHARPALYLVPTIVLAVPAILAFPGADFLLSSVVTNVFSMLRLRTAFLVVLGLGALTVASVLANTDVTGARVVMVTVYALASLAICLALAWFIGRIIAQSMQRARLIDQLTATRGELAEVSRQKGALDERQRIAREVHDAVAQNFSSVVLLVQAARSALSRGDIPTIEHQLDLAEGAAREGLSEARDLIGDLGPLALRSTSLVGALGRSCQEIGSRFGFSVSVEVSGEERPLLSALEVVLLRSAQGLLANVGLHARARSAVVHLQFLPESVCLEVRDDGVGFDPGAARGFGMSQLHARAGELGGRCEVSSAPGAGTKVIVEVPG